MPRIEFNGEERRDSKKWHEDECPYCEEHRFFKENRKCDNDDWCERPKKRRCNEDHWDCSDRCWSMPCNDWRRCPPWFWCKPEHDCDKECKRKDDCDKRRECGDLQAFAYVFSLSATAVTVAPNTDVLFTNNGPLEDVTHSPNTPQVFIRKSGAYEIYYGVNATAGSGATISLAVNGTVDPSTTIPIGLAPSETSGKVILNLRAGDFLTLRNSSTTTTITLATAPSVGAQLTLERISDIENKRDN